MFYKTRNEKKVLNQGFTIIELLIVVLIIGILGTIIIRVMNVRGIQAKSRDAQRKKDLNTISSVLEWYFADHREYPSNQNDLIPNYINVLPRDPLSDVSYLYDSETYISPARSSYVLVAEMEISTSADDSYCGNFASTLESAGRLGRDPDNCYLFSSPTSSIVPVVR
ncbi:prepilin-type N-terminal cleavage/methylation domain-containing protein [Patescibacteria group bacterium]|nr:prepilin-type N-terminal cleavage/methylation domain-containing protein [Patescibacteria group bacterium]